MQWCLIHTGGVDETRVTEAVEARRRVFDFSFCVEDPSPSLLFGVCSDRRRMNFGSGFAYSTIVNTQQSVNQSPGSRRVGWDGIVCVCVCVCMNGYVCMDMDMDM